MLIRSNVRTIIAIPTFDYLIKLCILHIITARHQAILLVFKLVVHWNKVSVFINLASIFAINLLKDCAAENERTL